MRLSRNDGLDGDSSIARVTSDSASLEPSLVAEVPQRLGPDLTVVVDLGAAADLAVVGIRVAAGVSGVPPVHRGASVADLAVDRLRAVEEDALAVVLEHHDSASPAVSLCSPWLTR